ncbi:MAG TPA: CHAT domain-containing protein [Rhizomicrobium sp.]
MNRTQIIVFAIATLAVTVCAASAADLGKNLAGEACHSDGPLVSGIPVSIRCGDAQEAAGQVAFVPAPKEKPRDGLAQFILSSSQNLNCEDPQWIGDVALRICTMKSNGWPRIVLGVQAGGKLYRAEGSPSALPALQAAIAANSHEPQASGDAILAAITSKLSAEATHSSASDYTKYKQSIEAARLAGAADNYAAAEANYRHALSIEERLFGARSVVVGQTIAELALQVSNQGRFDDAAALFRRAGPIIEASAADNVRARYDSYLALDAANQRHYADALKFARQATTARRAEILAAKQANAGFGDTIAAVPVSQGELAHALRIEAEMALRLGDLASAQATAEETLWIVSDDPGLPLWWRADTIALLGAINERRGRVVAAEHDLRDARDLDTKLFGQTAPTALIELKLGGFYSRQQVYPAALEAFHAAFAIAATDQVARAQVAPDDIVEYIAAEVVAGDPAKRDEQIFATSQLMNSSVADKTIARVAAREAAGNSDLSAQIAQAQSAEHDRDLARIQLAAEYSKPDGERSDERQKTLESNASRATDNAEALMAKVRQSFPAYAKLADPGAAGLAPVQAQLMANEALVSFVFGQTSGYALVVRQHSLDAVPLAIGEGDLAQDVADLRRGLVPSAGHLPDFSLKNSYALYQSLLKPLQEHLGGVGHLIVVPGSVLSSLPLALLVTAPPADQNYAGAAWLVQRYALSTVPSARAFLTLGTEVASHATAPRPFLGIGAPAFMGPTGTAGAKVLADLTSSCREAGPISGDMLASLPPLPGTAHEVRTVGSHIGGSNADILLDVHATEADFRAQPLDQFAVIYFATHGILPGELHCEGEPALALSPPLHTATSPAADGILQASEIAQLKLNADLIVLSACNTAESGDGGSALQGLSDAFFAAGARSVLASHWEVPSDATESLMIGLFDPANRASGLAQGLRRSQLALIAQSATAHPFYWAAFTIIGDDESAGRNTVRSAQLNIAGQP